MKFSSASLLAGLAGGFALSYDTQQPLIGPQNTISQPLLGFGTWNLKISSENTTEAVSIAIQAGYRQIDCAAAYGNEVAVGKGIKDGLKKANISREDIWVTSKLWNDHHGSYDNVEAGLNKTLKDLDVDYLDLYLMHWPVGNANGGKKVQLDYVETWRSMVSLPKSRVLNIGVSNFSPLQLRNLIGKTRVKPAVHQMELHPYLQQEAWIAANRALGISITAYSPLGNSNPTYHSFLSSPVSFFSSLLNLKGQSPPPLLENEVLKDIAQQRNCTPAQVALKWGMGRGTSVIPKSSHEDWIRENYESQRCLLRLEDLVRLKGVGSKWMTRFNNPSKNWGVKLFDGLDGA